jgi:hypothetical protein
MILDAPTRLALLALLLAALAFAALVSLRSRARERVRRRLASGGVPDLDSEPWTSLRREGGSERSRSP